MSSDNDADTPRRNTMGQFAKGSTGNPAGRPPKRRRLDVPNQLARDFVHLGRQVVTVPGPDGPREITRHEAVVESVFRAAMQGKVSAMKLWMEQTLTGWKDIEERHPMTALGEAMRQFYEDPSRDHGPGFLQAVDFWAKRLSRL